MILKSIKRPFKQVLTQGKRAFKLLFFLGQLANSIAFDASCNAFWKNKLQTHQHHIDKHIQTIFLKKQNAHTKANL